MLAIARAPLDAALAERVRPVTLARDRHVPVLPALERLLPSGLQQGIAVSVTAGPGGGATTLALALAAGVSEAGGWIAAIGLPGLGLVAGAQLGVALERLALVGCPPAQTSQIVAALVDGFPMVLVGPGMLGPRDGRRLAARLRERGTVLVIVDGDLADGATTLRLSVSSRWDHNDGAGDTDEVALLLRRRFVVTVTGRGAYGIERSDELLLEGQVFGGKGVRFESLGTRGVEAGGAGRPRGSRARVGQAVRRHG
jgi:hypothetical protein